MSFSDRIGATRSTRQIQLESIDESLRNALWNWAGWALAGSVRSRRAGVYQFWDQAARRGLWDEFFHLREADIPGDVQKSVRAWFDGTRAWWEIYNFIEYVLQNANNWRGYDERLMDLEPRLNYFLEREMSGYRAVKAQLVAISSTTEVEEIRQAATPVLGFEGVAVHIDCALALLSKKPDPDYRNSVKESISAVEAAVKLLTGEKSGGIDRALTIVERHHGLHKAFKDALSKLYGYTSDKDGIRHPILTDREVTGAEARFMLVACSAFANLITDLGKDIPPSEK